MERIKVLSAALALHEFTVDELVALSGVKRATVQSVLDRESKSHIVQRTGTKGLGQRGRPTNKWSIIDPQAARRITASHQAPLYDPAPLLPALNPDDRREVAVSVAEDALSQIVDEHNATFQRQILRSAQASLRMADDEQSSTDQRWWDTDTSQLAVRARATDALATLANTSEGELSEHLLEKTTDVVAAAIMAVPERGDALYFAPFSQILAGHDSLPPLIVALEGSPPPLVHGRWTELETEWSPEWTVPLLTQSWAAPLVGLSASMPLVFVSRTTYAPHSAPAEALVTQLLQRTRTTARPTLIIANANRGDLVRVSARFGASFVPMDWRSTADQELAIEAVTSVIERHTAAASPTYALTAGEVAAKGLPA